MDYPLRLIAALILTNQKPNAITKKSVLIRNIQKRGYHMHGKNDGMKNITGNDPSPSVMKGFIFLSFHFHIRKVKKTKQKGGN